MKNILLNVALLFILTAAISQELMARKSYVKVKPVPPEDFKPDPPSDNYNWVEGEWVWQTRNYVWHRGYWTLPPAGKVWKKGYWKDTKKGWNWIPGCWVKGSDHR